MVKLIAYFLFILTLHALRYAGARMLPIQSKEACYVPSGVTQVNAVVRAGAWCVIPTPLTVADAGFAIPAPAVALMTWCAPRVKRARQPWR
jgi:hypothetical protein